tara:strand:- start:1049 stop:1195 length:147 start_codon:yes stop_codon:yes gene_type:complete
MGWELDQLFMGMVRAINVFGSEEKDAVAAPPPITIPTSTSKFSQAWVK